MSTNDTGADETPQMISQDQTSFSVTKNDTAQTTIEKLRQRCLLLQQRRTTALRQYEESEKRKTSLQQASEESEQRNQKLQKKITYYKESLQQQITNGLQQQQERLVELQQQLNTNKHRSQELEDNRRNLIETNLITHNRIENQIRNIIQQKEGLKQQATRQQTNIDELSHTQEVFMEQIGKLIGRNQQVMADYQKLVLSVAHSSDENYSAYVQQIIQAKQLTNPNHNVGNDVQYKIQQMSQINANLLTQVGTFYQQPQGAGQMTDSQKNETFTNFLVNKCEYGNEWTRDIRRPKQEQTVQVNTPSKNMNASITIFDEETGDNYTFSQQVQENTPVVKRVGKANQQSISSSIYSRSYGSNPIVEVTERPQVRGKARRASAGAKQVKFQQTDNYTRRQQDKTIRDLRQKQTVQERRIHTQSRMDIILGLEEKIKQATEDKIQLQRRLEAINKSYANTSEKQVRMNKIRTQITSKMVELKMMKDRLKKVKALK